MWRYNQPIRPDELYHSKNHKYVAKVGEGKDAKYFYSQKEYQAYLNSNKKAGFFKSIRSNTDLKNGKTTEHVYDRKGKEVGSYEYVLGNMHDSHKSITLPKQNNKKNAGDFTKKIKDNIDKKYDELKKKSSNMSISDIESDAKSTYHDINSKVKSRTGKYYKDKAIKKIKNGDIDSAANYTKKAISKYTKASSEKIKSYAKKGKKAINRLFDK